MSCRAKWNAYTEDQLLHNGQGTSNGQYWEQHVKQVCMPPAAEIDLQSESRSMLGYCYAAGCRYSNACCQYIIPIKLPAEMPPLSEEHCDCRSWLPRLTSGAQQSRRRILMGSLHRSTSTTC